MISSARSFSVMFVTAVIIIAPWLIRSSNGPELTIGFAGFTNHFRGLGREALIAVTNQSASTLFVTFLAERKSPDWPVHSRFALKTDVVLSGRGVTNFAVRLQPNEGVWRVRVLYHSPVTPWQRTRNRWSLKLRAYNCPRVAAFIEPNLVTAVVTPELKL